MCPIFSPLQNQYIFSVLISLCCLEYATYVSHLLTTSESIYIQCPYFFLLFKSTRPTCPIFSPHQNQHLLQCPYFLLLFRVRDLRVPSSQNIRICISYSILTSICCLEYATYVSHLLTTINGTVNVIIYYVKHGMLRFSLFRPRRRPSPDHTEIVRRQ